MSTTSGINVRELKLGNVVTTTRAVSIITFKGKRDGTALPGWEWRITAVLRDHEGRVRFEVVADAAPGLYKQVLSEKVIAQKVR